MAFTECFIKNRRRLMTKEMNAAERKAHPIFTGVLKYFPNALLEVAAVSKKGNDQHNPGEPLHWAMEKSTDEGDALVRHQLDAGTRDTDGERHSAKVAWRALAQLEREILAEQAAAGVAAENCDTDEEPEPYDRSLLSMAERVDMRPVDTTVEPHFATPEDLDSWYKRRTDEEFNLAEPGRIWPKPTPMVDRARRSVLSADLRRRDIYED
jgi:hypothetical protein